MIAMIIHVTISQHGVKFKTPTPCKMKRGSATTNHNFAYVTPYGSTSVHSYEWTTEQWKELAPCPYRDSALVIIDGALTAVGGEMRSDFSSNLLTLRQGSWGKVYPPMKTARSQSAVASKSDYVVVVGGRGCDGGWISTVELLDVKAKHWHLNVSDLPQPLTKPSAAVCGNQIHVIGEECEGYSCFIQPLPPSGKAVMFNPIKPWNPLPRLPVRASTAATLSGQLVIVGGKQDSTPVLSGKAIHQLLNGKWVKIGSLSRDREWCLVASHLQDNMIIIGGVDAAESFEICFLYHQSLSVV